MKKLISLGICLVMLLSGITAIKAEEPAEVEGLHEKLEALYFNKHFTQEQIAEMDKEYVKDYDYDYWNRFLPAAKEIGKTKTDNDTDEYNYWFKFVKLDYSRGVKVSLTSTNKYIKQYADNGCFDYLFSGREYWSILNDELDGEAGRFRLNGEVISYIGSDYEQNNYRISLTKEAIDFIYNETAIKNQLIEKGETKVDDMKIFAEGYGLTFLYIKCNEDEYLIKLYDSNGYAENLPNIKSFELYAAKELITEDERQGVENQPTYVTPIKPTYDTEAAELQAEGLLNGNENGLDLLKPLTRIEAAAMLLRAKGESTDDAETTQVFTDVPSTHWGYGVAAKAYSEGIISGMGDNTFAPDNVVSATQFAAMTLRAASDPTEDWTQSLQSLIDRGIVTEEETKTMDLFTRGDMAKIIYEARTKGLL